MSKIIFIAIGGATGAVLRYGVGEFAKATMGSAFPIGTLIVNVLGCFALGMVMKSSFIPEAHHPLVAVGFLGALTTFSTFGFQTLDLMERQEWGFAFGNVAANLILGLGAVWLGTLIGKWLL